SEPGAVAAWLRQGEVLASEINCDRWNPKEFRKQLDAIRSLTRESDPKTFMPILTNLCASCGVALIRLRAPKGCKASGAAKFLPTGNPMILLSGRYRRDDHFWFTFYHEAGHLMLHRERLFFIDNPPDDDVTSQEESEANEFAEKLLIPAEYHDEFLKLT